jgi:hypothetical protein
MLPYNKTSNFSQNKKHAQKSFNHLKLRLKIFILFTKIEHPMALFFLCSLGLFVIGLGPPTPFFKMERHRKF